MPLEKVDDQKQIRLEQYRQLRSFLAGLAEQAVGRRAPLPTGGLEIVKQWQQEIRPRIEKILGWPAPIAPFEPQLVSEEEIGSDDLVRSIRRMTIRVAEGLDVYGILLLPHRENPKLMICFHGGAGCPELVTSVCNSNNYNDGARKFVALGFAVFAPLLVLRREEEFEAEWPLNYRTGFHMNALWAGTTVLAVELEKVRRALTFFDSYDGVDTSDVGVAGLSYGGYYTLYAAALIDRLSFAVISCSFNDRLAHLKANPDSLMDWRYPEAGELFGEAEIAALICPKPLYIESGQSDPLFSIENATSEAEKIGRVYEDCGAPFLYDAFEGGHEFMLSHIGEFLKDIER